MTSPGSSMIRQVLLYLQRPRSLCPLEQISGALRVDWHRDTDTSEDDWYGELMVLHRRIL